MPDILHRIGIKAPAERVYAALTEQSCLAGWWTKDVQARGEVGAVNHFQFGAAGFDRMSVLELEHAKRVRWQCIDGADEWIGTELTFDLKEQGGLTVVLFAHRDWKEQVEFMHYCSTKWAVFLLSLKSLLETGKGAPWPNEIKLDSWE